jgi:hypothetical protein
VWADRVTGAVDASVAPYRLPGYRDGSSLMSGDVVGLASHTVAVLRRCGVFVADDGVARRSTTPTPEGSTFARAALRTWR